MDFPFVNWFVALFFLFPALIEIQGLLEDIVEGSLGVKEGQKFVWSLSLPERLKARVFRAKLKRFQREFEGYLKLRKVLLIATGVCLLLELLLWLCNWQEASEKVVFFHAAALIIVMFVLIIHGKVYWHRSKYNRTYPPKNKM